MKRLFVPLVAVGLLGGIGCFRDSRPTHDRSAAGLFDRAPDVSGPVRDRCATYPPGARAHQCSDAKYLAEIYVRNLSVGDEICLEHGFGSPPTGTCLARGKVMDASPKKLLVEVRDARPNSRWFNRISSDMWFSESALVDLYLAERGY